MKTRLGGSNYPPQIEEYSDEQSEPLVEQVDPDYEPTERQVGEYAIETLGMNLPEDQNLLYLARQGLKAPIPANWVPYQSREGEIYYKHKITQEKIYDHPTDIEYRKKFQQQKEKMARKNLKSIGLKNNMSVGIGNPLSFSQSNFHHNPLSQSNNMYTEEDALPQPSIDPAVLEQYDHKLQQLEKKEQKQWKSFREEQIQKHEKKIQKITQEYEDEFDRIHNRGKYENRDEIEKKIADEKKKIKQRIQQNENLSLQQELRLVQKSQESKLQEYTAIYEEDRKIKLNKLEDQLESTYIQKEKNIQELERKNVEKHERKKQERQKTLHQLKQELMNPENKQIVKATEEALKDKVMSIKEEFHRKIKEKQNQLESELIEMKKVLGLDTTQHLQNLAQRKTKMQTLSQQKLKSHKNKQLQKLNHEFIGEYEKKTQELLQKVEMEHESAKRKHNNFIQNKLMKRKQRINQQYEEKIQKSLNEIFSENKCKLAQFERTMNSKMSELRMEFIHQLEKKGKEGDDMLKKMLLKQKQQQVRNKEEMIRNLYCQLEIDKTVYAGMKFDQEILECENIDGLLKRKLKNEGIEYKPPAYMDNLQIFQTYKKKYHQDKKILGQILRKMQETAIYPFYEKQRLSEESKNKQFIATQASSALIKKYNEDVRKMRKNEEMLNKFQILLKKAEINNPQILSELQNSKIEYMEISFKNDVEIAEDNHIFYEEKKRKSSPKLINNYTQSAGYKNIQTALQEHSKFLANVKNQLNRKLYQVRSTAFYNY